MSSSKVSQFSVAITRTTNYNSIKIDTTYDYTGSSPKGFTQKEMNQLIDQTMRVADQALEDLKSRVAAPATVRQLK